MKYKVTQEQVKKIIPKLEKSLNSYFSSNDRICGFKIFLNDEEDPYELLDVYMIINKEWSDNDFWSDYRTGHIRDEVKEYFKDVSPFTFEVYYYSKKCS